MPRADRLGHAGELSCICCGASPRHTLFGTVRDRAIDPFSVDTLGWSIAVGGGWVGEGARGLAVSWDERVGGPANGASSV